MTPEAQHRERCQNPDPARDLEGTGVGGIAHPYSSVGNAVIESFWARMQTELLDRKRWKTRVELASAIFEYLEIFHNRTRRHSSLGMLTPVEYEKLSTEATEVA